jgi:phospholipid/cholesterol/gamma-HCH transport system substrate-binding protein
VQLVVFALIALVGIAYAGFNYVGLGQVFGIHGYVVKVELADSGGIFTNAEVSYRGVTVGRVGALNLTDTGVEVDLDIDPSSPQIPASSKAVVADRSAVGEQYVDLEPPNGNGPMLHDGSVIQRDDTAIPIAPQDLLNDLDQLALSVPTDSLRTTVNEADAAFNGTGPDLQKLLDSANSFTKTAIQHVPQTAGLLSNGVTVLGTQQAEAAQIESFSTSLDQLAGQLRSSDPAIRNVITSLPPVAQEVDNILRDTGNDTGILIANLLTTAQITSSRTNAITQALVEYPYAVAAQPSADPDGTGHLGFVLDLFDPMPCTQGYQGTVEHPASDVNTPDPNNQAYCALPPQTGTEVRGSNNAPYGGMPQEVAPPSAQEPNGGNAELPGLIGASGVGSGPGTLGGLLGVG